MVSNMNKRGVRCYRKDKQFIALLKETVKKMVLNWWLLRQSAAGLFCWEKVMLKINMNAST